MNKTYKITIEDESDGTIVLQNTTEELQINQSRDIKKDINTDGASRLTPSDKTTVNICFSYSSKTPSVQCDFVCESDGPCKNGACKECAGCELLMMCSRCDIRNKNKDASVCFKDNEKCECAVTREELNLRDVKQNELCDKIREHNKPKYLEDVKSGAFRREGKINF